MKGAEGFCCVLRLQVILHRGSLENPGTNPMTEPALQTSESHFELVETRQKRNPQPSPQLCRPPFLNLNPQNLKAPQ